MRPELKDKNMKQQYTNPRVAIRSRALTTAVLFTCAAVLTLPLQALADGGHRGDDRKKATRIIPPNQEAYGTSYSELAGAWWDWAVNQPPDMNPILDETGEFAHVGQNEDYGQGKSVFFLAGNFGGETVRSCTVPRGKALFFPIVNGLWIAPEEGNTEECRQAVNEFVGWPTEMQCIIDGVPVEDIRAYRAQSPPGGSPFHIQAGSLLESLDPGFYVPRGYVTGSVADGYWLLVKLGDGNQHVIEFSGTLGDPESPDFQLSVKYILTVVGDEDHDHHRDGDGDGDHGR
jgi:hypothetical protein